MITAFGNDNRRNKDSSALLPKCLTHLIDFHTVLLFTTLRLQFFISTDLSGNGV